MALLLWLHPIVSLDFDMNSKTKKILKQQEVIGGLFF